MKTAAPLPLPIPRKEQKTRKEFYEKGFFKMTLKSSILLIEDEENIRSFIATTLKNQGYKITTASTGREGLHLSASLCPDKTAPRLGIHSYHRDLCQKP